MHRRNILPLLMVLLSPSAAILADPRGDQRKPPLIHAFVIVGQSNMVGHGIVAEDTPGEEANGTCRSLVKNFPDQYGMLQDERGSWVERQDVWIAYNRQYFVNETDPVINQHGNLSVGFGGDPGQHGQVGPELGFGWALGDRLNRPGVKQTKKILLIKIAWGGKSLAIDFRPPSSGGTVGPYYEAMVANVKKTLSNLTSFFPSIESRVQLSGFAWHQGWNDGCDEAMTAEYEANLANFIRDIRTDFFAPDLPVSIGVTGMIGFGVHGLRERLVQAQLAVANETRYPEFSGTVSAVETRGFAREPAPHSPSDFDFHWMNNCESYWLVGKAMGVAMADILQWKDVSTADISLRNESTPQVSTSLY